MTETTQDGADVVERLTEWVLAHGGRESSGFIRPIGVDDVADALGELTRLRSDNERLREALRAAYVELAALIPIPSADDPEWPMFPLNAADHECLNNAYLGIRAALQETSNG